MPATEAQLITTDTLPYLLARPPAAAGRQPLLCFLHGLDEGPPTAPRVGLTRHGPLRPASAAASGEFIVVAPQAPARGDTWRFYADAVLALVARVQGDCAGDPHRLYLTGFSFGGNGVFDLALGAPQTWAALWAVDPTRVPARDPGLPVWLSAGAASRSGGRRFIERLRLQPPSATGANDRIYLDEGLDHVGTATSAYGDERIYRWLLRHRRPA